MDAFSRRPINPEPKDRKSVFGSLMRRVLRSIPKNKAEYQQKKIPFFLLIITVLIAGGLIFQAIYTTYQYITHFDAKDLLSIFSTELQKDDKDRTNILLLGTGGGDHDGADLTDTIMIASIQHESQRVSLFSIPRDLWLNLPGYGSSRINKIYDTLNGDLGSSKALHVLREGVEGISGQEIPYYVKIDFQGFQGLIDTLGGIEVTVEKSIYDTEYPKADQSGYETFSIEAGTQVLDGETALKYARSRHSTSDFDRAERQQQILNAIKKKASEIDFLTSPLLLKKLYEEFSEHIETNLETSELIALSQFARNLDRDDISSAVLKDTDVIDTGSFLYTPSRELYGGAFVLVPIGDNYDRVKAFIEMVFSAPEFFDESATIQVLNGTSISGLASGMGSQLIPYGFNIQRYGNADQKAYVKSHYYVRRNRSLPGTRAALKQLFPEMKEMEGNLPEELDDDYDITIILGTDWAERDSEL